MWQVPPRVGRAREYVPERGRGQGGRDGKGARKREQRGGRWRGLASCAFLQLPFSNEQELLKSS